MRLLKEINVKINHAMVIYSPSQSHAFTNGFPNSTYLPTYKNAVGDEEAYIILHTYSGD